MYTIQHNVGALMDDTKYYTTFDVIKILDIKMERLQDWLKRGYIKPSDQKPVGRGLKNYFDLFDLYIIETFKYLVENGITRQEAASWISTIKETLDAGKQAPKSPRQLKKNIEHIDWKPKIIAFYKGSSAFGDSVKFIDQDVTTHMTNNNKCTLTFDSETSLEAAHVINFERIFKKVDAKLEE